MTREEFIKKLARAAQIDDQWTLRTLRLQNPEWFDEEVARIRALGKNAHCPRPLGTVPLPKSKSEERRRRYMAGVREKKKAGINR